MFVDPDETQPSGQAAELSEDWQRDACQRGGELRPLLRVGASKGCARHDAQSDVHRRGCDSHSCARHIGHGGNAVIDVVGGQGLLVGGGVREVVREERGGHQSWD